MENLTLTARQARRFILAHQGLWPPYELTGKPGVLEYVRRVGCIQFDPLNIVGHNSDLVLQSRVTDLTPTVLQELLYEDRKLVDGWDKNMSIYCTEDWPYFRRRREAAKRRPGKSPGLVRSVLPQVRAALGERGPLSSLDLEFDRTVDWSWAPTRLARAALESMYFWGELIIHHKVHTRIKPPLYMRSEDKARLDNVLDADDPSPRATVIAPLDNLIWDRRLAKELFDFDYLWEVYKPVVERRYGYYVLPVLYGDRFVARFEPGRDKQSRALIVKKWWWESEVTPSEGMQSDLRHCFQRFLNYLGAKDLQIDGGIAQQTALGWLTSR